MKLKCISNIQRAGWSSPDDQSSRLTVGKIYTGQIFDYQHIIVFDDKKEWVAFEKSLFVPAEEE